MRVRFGALSLLFLSAVTAPAQQVGTQDASVFRTSTDLVTIDAVVTDRDGKIVTNLTRDDFDVTVAGKHKTLEQAVYVRTQEQPQVLAAARAAAVPDARHAAEPRPDSLASQTLRTTGITPDKVARTIALVVDDLGLSFRSMYDVRRSVQKYIDTQVEPGDLVAIIRTSGGVGALQQFTTDRRLLRAAADHLQFDFRSRAGAFAAVSENENVPAGLGVDSLDQLHDTLSSVGSMAALQYIARGVSQLPGRKCIVYFSDGFSSIFADRMGAGDSRTEGSGRIWNAMSRMLALANAAGVVINTIDARGLQTGMPTADTNSRADNWREVPGRDLASGAESSPGSGAGFLDVPGHQMGAADNFGYRTLRRGIIDAQESLKFIADQTGGLAIENTNDLNLGIRRILDDQEGYYLLGYAASEDSPRSGWDQNRVKVRVKRPGLQVRARQGFFGPLDSRGPKVESVDPLVTSALSPFGSGGITVRLTSVFAHDAKAGSYVRSLVFIDPGDLHFETDQTGKHTARLQLLVMAIGDNGQVLDGQRREVPLALTDQNFQLIKEHGLVVSVRTTAKEAGPYQMRVAVADLTSRTVGSAAQFLEVPEVGRGRLALSGVLLKGVTASETTLSTEPPPSGLVDAVLSAAEVRVFSAGDKAVYAYEIYDGLKGDNVDLQMATALIREGKIVYQGPFEPVTATPKGDGKMRAIPIAGTLALGTDMPAGPYTLEVTVRRPNARKLERKQWLDFEIRR